MALYDAGQEDHPTLAPDPQSQRWDRTQVGSVLLRDVSPDPGTGLNAWEINDSGNGHAYYGQRFTGPEFSHLFSSGMGWTYSLTLKLSAADDSATALEFRTPGLDLDPAGPDPDAADTAAGSDGRRYLEFPGLVPRQEPHAHLELHGRRQHPLPLMGMDRSPPRGVRSCVARRDPLLW